MNFNDLSIITNCDQILSFDTENRGASLGDTFSLAHNWNKASVSLSRYDLDLVIAASAVLAFN